MLRKRTFMSRAAITPFPFPGISITVNMASSLSEKSSLERFIWGSGGVSEVPVL